MADDPNSPGPALELLLCGTWSTTERDTWAAALRAAMPRHRLHLERPTGTPIDVAIVANPPAGALNGLPRLRLIQSLWAGVDRLLADPTLPPQVPVARMVDPAMNAAMAETALWAALSLQRGTFRYAHQQRAACWRLLPQRRADEWTVLVLGLGQMGRTAARALVRQGYRVRGWSRQPALAEVGVTLFHGDAALPQACAYADVLINLLPLTLETRGLLNARRLAWLPRGAAVVNLARGAHVVDDDLLRALDAGAIGHAVLDVFYTEPLPSDHPYWHHPGVTVLPHAAAQTDPRSAAAVVALNVAAVQDGRMPSHLVDRARGY